MIFMKVINENGPDKARSEVRRQKLIIPKIMMMMMMGMWMVMTMTMIQSLHLKMSNDNKV